MGEEKGSGMGRRMEDKLWREMERERKCGRGYYAVNLNYHYKGF